MEKKVSKCGNKIPKKLSKIISGRKSSTSKSKTKPEKDAQYSLELLFCPSPPSSLTCDNASRIASTCNQHLRNRDPELENPLEAQAEVVHGVTGSTHSAKSLLVKKRGKLRLPSNTDSQAKTE